MNGRLIAAQTGADIEVIEHFALLHDVKRYDESRDIDHGGRAVEFTKTLIGDWIHLDHSQTLKLVEGHCQNKPPCPTAC